MARALDPKAKAKRQKIVAAVGGVILVGLLIWRVPPMIALMNKKPPTGSSPAASAPAPVAPGPATPVVPGAGAPGGSAQLADSDVSPTAGPGQLVSFGRFVSKDPFVQQSGRRCVDSAGVTVVCPPTRTRTPAARPRPPKEPQLKLEPPPPPSPSTPKPSARTGARISVNGKAEGVAVGATFPTADPVFRLVSLTGTTARIAIDGGSYASGESAITLTKGRPVTLVNTADGTRYRLVVL